MSENQTTLRFNYRLRPGKNAEARLVLEWNCSRWVWNQCVEAGDAAYKLFKESGTEGPILLSEISRNLTKLRSELEWLRQGSRVAQSQAMRKWYDAYRQAFKRPNLGFPKFKSGKTALPSIEYTCGAFRIKDGALCLVGGISIPIVWSRELPSKPTSCVVFQDQEGHWNVSFVVRRENKELPPSNESIGIDWGVSVIASTTSPSFDLHHGNTISKYAVLLKTAHQKVSRAKNGSAGRSVAKKRLAKIYAKIANHRKDKAFKWSRKIVSSFGRLAIENFKPKFLSKTTLAKKSSNGAVGMTKRILIDMARASGRIIALINPAYTTMDCSECGTRATSRLSLSNRTFECHACGFTAGRDLNAARTIRVRAGFTPDDVDDIRLKHDKCCASAFRVMNPLQLERENSS